ALQAVAQQIEVEALGVVQLEAVDRFRGGEDLAGGVVPAVDGALRIVAPAVVLPRRADLGRQLWRFLKTVLPGEVEEAMQALAVGDGALGGEVLEALAVVDGGLGGGEDAGKR